MALMVAGFAQIANGTFHGPLHIANGWTFLKCFWHEVDDLVDSRSNKVELVMTKLVINEFEVMLPGAEECMCISKCSHIIWKPWTRRQKCDPYFIGRML